MNIEDCLVTTYPTIYPFEGVINIEDKFIGKGYLVVVDEQNNYIGILTPFDLVRRPHKLVVDCLTSKDTVSTEDSPVEVFGKFNKNNSEALPVFKDGKFKGVLEKGCVLEKLKTQVDKLYKEYVISQQIKTSFLHNLSHEIRTPLNQILGFMSIIAKLSPEEIASDAGEQYLSIVKSSSEQFLMVMNDLIELSLINQGDNTEVQIDSAEIEPLFSDLKIYFEIDSKCSGYMLSIDYFNPGNRAAVYTDGKKLKQILFHLINTSINHSYKNNQLIKIEFGVEPLLNESIIRFYVKNASARINNDQKAIIFEAMSKQDFPEDTGLGRNLNFGMNRMKTLVRMINAKFEIDVDSSGIITAYVSIPIITELH